MENLTIVKVNINDLKESEYNPRKSTQKQKDQLKDSIKEFGFIDPIIVNSAAHRHNIIIGGHFRYTVAKELGMSDLPVIYLEISDIDKEMALNVRLNKNTASFDINLLANFDDKVLSEVGFKQKEMTKIFGLDLSDDEENKKDKTVISEWKVEVGEVYMLGEHKLVLSDNGFDQEVEKSLKAINKILKSWEKNTGIKPIKI